MKKNLFKLAGLVISGLLLGACSQMATFENEDLLLQQEAAAAKSGFNLTPYGTGGNENARAFVTTPDCPTDCLIKGEAVTFSKTYEQTIVTGNNSKKVMAVVSLVIGVNNMAYYKIDYSSQRTDGNSNPDVFLYGTLNGASFGSMANSAGKWNTTNPVTGSFSTSSFDYSTIECGDTFSFSLTEISNGNDGSLSGTLTQLAYCEDSCVIEGNEFEGAAVSCGASREANYTFGSEDGVSYFKMQGGLTAFTGSNATVYINGSLVVFNSTSSDDWATGIVGAYTVGQRNPGNSTNRNIRVEGGLGECEDVLVRVVWTSDNTDPTITGEWSVKDAVGVELAPEVAELFCD